MPDPGEWRYRIEPSHFVLPCWYVVVSQGWTEHGGMFIYGSKARAQRITERRIARWDARERRRKADTSEHIYRRGTA